MNLIRIASELSSVYPSTLNLFNIAIKLASRLTDLQTYHPDYKDEIQYLYDNDPSSTKILKLDDQMFSQT